LIRHTVTTAVTDRRNAGDFAHLIRHNANAVTDQNTRIKKGDREANRIAENSATRVRVTADDLHETLGARKFESEVAMRTSISGVATGLAWTPVGGDILFIEATRVPGKTASS
jgi:ATP-dependent Lon protease